MLDLKRLRFLREVAERGTISAAADALAYTPSAVSQQIAILEEELQTPLLERQGRNVVLTPAGKVLVSHSHAVFDAVERATTAVSEASGEVAGRVVVGALQSVMATLLPETIRTMSIDHPRVDLHMTELGHVDATRELRLGALDVAVDQAYTHVTNRAHLGLTKHKVLEEPLYLVVPKDSGVKKLADAAEWPWVAASLESCDCGRAVRHISRAAGFEPDVRFETDDYGVTLELLNSINAVSILPALTLTRMPSTLRRIPIAGVRRRIVALTRPAGDHRPAVGAFIEHLQRAASELLPIVTAA
ncbi:MAG TPA: LysR family transcriptional regulator [Acidimicrobiia bacterium]|nr:LysR family transcriptional regulator [Acidimicrobiia bacterium]